MWPGSQSCRQAEKHPKFFGKEEINKERNSKFYLATESSMTSTQLAAAAAAAADPGPRAVHGLVSSIKKKQNKTNKQRINENAHPSLSTSVRARACARATAGTTGEVPPFFFFAACFSSSGMPTSEETPPLRLPPTHPPTRWKHFSFFFLCVQDSQTRRRARDILIALLRRAASEEVEQVEAPLKPLLRASGWCSGAHL